MSNRTDWEELAKEIVQTWLDEDTRNLRVLRDRIETELHNAWVAGREGSPEVWAQFAPPAIHIDNIIVHADDPDRLAFGLIDAFTKEVTGEMAIPTDFGPLTIKSDPTLPPGHDRMVDATMHQPGTVTFVDSPPLPRGAPPVLIDGLTPEQCRERWLVNRSEQEIPSGCKRPVYELTPAQIEAGKRYRTIQDAVREAFDASLLRVLVKTSDAERKTREPSIVVDLGDE